ncbi:hypothetical protein [Chryseobacterium indoltheticum]|uniref:KTSC domain-containing protein n=1 Tax=Chryseobacterium indoltheticum TaxID=254 RepID=A0A381FAL3_9FLAO|nr:hypothetical protein [Chryseobacterium indoltheticum]AZA73555.1 hypothetical protein EG358_07215 [Chryseobacterium indoltheticum]SIR24551.1 hypothetical protein SAMN05421682_115101 [Chryseobacterium indoltheticum]SUX43494.1 Uncharacterised protein [Chryseobacterium indoltheticum]
MKSLLLKIGSKQYTVIDWEHGFSKKYHVVVTFTDGGIKYINSDHLCYQACLLYTYDKARAEKFYKSIPESDEYSISLSKQDKVLLSK